MVTLVQITSSSNVNSAANLSLLKSANLQPTLAGELISKTVEGLMQAQSAQTPPQPVLFSTATGTGGIIDTSA